MTEASAGRARHGRPTRWDSLWRRAQRPAHPAHPAHPARPSSRAATAWPEPQAAPPWPALEAMPPWPAPPATSRPAPAQAAPTQTMAPAATPSQAGAARSAPPWPTLTAPSHAGQPEPPWLAEPAPSRPAPPQAGPTEAAATEAGWSEPGWSEAGWSERATAEATPTAVVRRRLPRLSVLASGWRRPPLGWPTGWPGGVGLRLASAIGVGVLAVVIAGWSPAVVGVLTGVLTWLLLEAGRARSRHRPR